MGVEETGLDFEPIRFSAAFTPISAPVDGVIFFSFLCFVNPHLFFSLNSLERVESREEVRERKRNIGARSQPRNPCHARADVQTTVPHWPGPEQ